MAAVGRKCGAELAAFERCVLAAKGDTSKCADVQRELSQCAARAVPLLQHVKRHCSAHIDAYDACIRTNGHKTDDELTQLCTPKLKALWQCTEMVKQHAAAVAAESS